MVNRIGIFHVIAFACLAFFFGCKKEPTQTVNPGFIKEFVFDDSAVSGSFIWQTSQNELLIVGTKGASPMILKTDAMGNLLSHQSASGKYYSFLNVTKLSDGTFFCSSSDHFFDMDGSANLQWAVDSSVLNYYFQGSQVVMNGGNYLMGLSEGYFSANQTLNVIFRYDKNHVLLSSDSFVDPAKTGKTLSIWALELRQDGEYNVFGSKYANPSWNWDDPLRIYIGKTASKVLNIHVLDSGLTRYSDHITNYINTADSGFLINASRYDYKSANSYILIIKLDKDLNFQSEHTYSYNTLSTTGYGISPCRDGGYLISGGYNTSLANTNSNPYVLRIDKKGNKLWDKVISMPGSSWFNSGIELQDGSLMFTGSTSSYGKGVSRKSAFLVKLDANGNL